MAKFGHILAQGSVNQNLPWCVYQMLIGPEDMGNTHGYVVDDHSKIICRDAIGLKYNKISHVLGLELDLIANQVLNHNFCVSRDLKANGGLEARGQILFYLG